MDSYESLQLLYRSYTYDQIEQLTGVPRSTIGFVLRGERALPEKYKEGVSNAGYFRAYQSLTDQGAGNKSAMILAGQSLNDIDNAMYTYESIAQSYAMAALEKSNRTSFDEESGRLVYYNLNQEMEKYKAILNKWDVTLADVMAANPYEYPPLEK